MHSSWIKIFSWRVRNICNLCPFLELQDYFSNTYKHVGKKLFYIDL
jgi:hypothetical protein